MINSEKQVNPDIYLKTPNKDTDTRNMIIRT